MVIGRWVYAASQILLLDEPTRGVDIEAKQQIYRIVRELAAEGKSVVFISSEVEELPLVCDRILLLQHGTFSQEFHSPVNVDELDVRHSVCALMNFTEEPEDVCFVITIAAGQERLAQTICQSPY